MGAATIDLNIRGMGNNNMRRFLLIMLTVLLLAGCSAPLQTESVIPSDAAQQTESPEPIQPDMTELSRAMKRSVEQNLAIDFADMELPAQGLDNQEFAQNCGVYGEMTMRVKQAGERTVGKEAEKPEYNQITVETEIAVPSWQVVGALHNAFGAETSDLLEQSAQVEVDADENSVCVAISWPALDEIAATKGEALMSAKFMLAYVNTVYDDAGEEKPYEGYPLSDEYIATLADPLPGAHIKDGWYNDRDKGVRKHTGTDIRSPEGTDILSCTDGTVAYIGSNAGAGNYVVVRDDLGFEYHYYHMVRMTDFLQPGDRVSKGDVIGHVGNTGNSAANHLHLTIISPEYTYINPYPVLVRVREMMS